MRNNIIFILIIIILVCIIKPFINNIFEYYETNDIYRNDSVQKEMKRTILDNADRFLTSMGLKLYREYINIIKIPKRYDWECYLDRHKLDGTDLRTSFDDWYSKLIINNTLEFGCNNNDIFNDNEFFDKLLIFLQRKITNLENHEKSKRDKIMYNYNSNINSEQIVYRTYDVDQNNIIPKVTFDNANQFCEDLGGHIPIIKNFQQRSHILATQNEKKLNNIWLGAKKISGEHTWIDGDNTSIYTQPTREHHEYINDLWPPLGNNFQNTRMCLKQNDWGEWEDVDCTEKLNVLCDLTGKRKINIKLQRDYKSDIQLLNTIIQENKQFILTRINQNKLEMESLLEKKNSMLNNDRKTWDDIITTQIVNDRNRMQEENDRQEQLDKDFDIYYDKITTITKILNTLSEKERIILGLPENIQTLEQQNTGNIDLSIYNFNAPQQDTGSSISTADI